ELGRDQRRVADAGLVEPRRRGQGPEPAAHSAGMRFVIELERLGLVQGLVHFHRMTWTRVPRPTVEWISNSLTRRREPPRPSPSPPPVVKPSRSAASMSGMAGPS